MHTDPSTEGYHFTPPPKGTLRVSVAQSTVLPSLRHRLTFSQSSSGPRYAPKTGEELK